MKSEISSRTYILAISFTVALGGLLFGYDTAVISGAEQALQQRFIEPLGLSSFIHGLTVSSALIGCVIGGVVSGVIADRIGRKHALILTALLFFTSSLASAYPEFLFFSDGEASIGLLVMFNIYRVIGGIGVGMASALCPAYISEVAPPQLRGKLVISFNVAVIVGMLVVYVVNWSITNGQTSEWIVDIGWRYMLASETVPAFFFLFFLLFIPETPRYLLLNNRVEEATSVLMRITGSYNQTKQMINEIRTSITRDSASNVFAFGKAVLIVGITIACFQQFIGINVILYYAPRVFEGMGATQGDSFALTIMLGVVNLVFMFIAIYFIDRWGRRPLLLLGSTLCSISMFGVAFLSLLEMQGILTMIFILAFAASFTMSWGPIAWVLLSEIFPNRIRSRAIAIAVALHWTANLTISSTFPLVNGLWGGGAFIIYGMFSLLSIFIVWKWLPETKGKSLEEIEEHWLKQRKSDKKIG